MQVCRQALTFWKSLLPPYLGWFSTKPLYVIFTGLSYPTIWDSCNYLPPCQVLLLGRSLTTDAVHLVYEYQRTLTLLPCVVKQFPYQPVAAEQCVVKGRPEHLHQQAKTEGHNWWCCMKRGAHSDAVEDSNLLGCDTVLLGERFLTFQRTAVTFTSGSSSLSRKLMDCMTLRSYSPSRKLMDHITLRSYSQSRKAYGPYDPEVIQSK
jgi:hypothetical protein